jgi:hypothetical protein
VVVGPVRKHFVEGGGEKNASLHTECRSAFRKLLERAGLGGRMPRIVACGSRRNALDQFCTAVQCLRPGDVAILLVDSEDPISMGSPWEHVRDRQDDRWSRPLGATDDHLHLMVECMEAWFLADRGAMRSYFGNGFKANRLPPEDALPGSVQKDELLKSLRRATGDCSTGSYRKGAHAFKLLACMNPDLIRKRSPWAERFFSTLGRLLLSEGS